MSMTTHASAPEIVIVVQDGALPLSELEGFSADYTTGMAAPVTIRSQWGGPLADGLYIEVAVAIMVGQLLRQVGSDAYELAKGHIRSIYHKIRSDSGARTYGTAILALVAEDESESDSVALYFCFPPGLTEADILARWHSIEQQWRRLSREWSTQLDHRVRDHANRARVDLCLDDETGEWCECV